MAGPEYGRTSQQTLAGPAYEQYGGGAAARQQQQQYAQENAPPMSKSKRRESSMFGMNMGMGLAPRKASNNKLNDPRKYSDAAVY